jgi:hypothetical protein
MVELRVPGSVYWFCLDPGVSEIAKDTGWSADVVRRGRGWQAIYVVSEEDRLAIIEWVRNCAAGLIGACGAGEDNDARVALRWARKAG